MLPEITIRPAREADVGKIAALLDPYARSGTVLPRDEENIRFYLRNFRVATACDRVIGCVATRDVGGMVLEVRRHVVAPDFQGRGIGKALVENEISRLREKGGTWRLFTLTRTPRFFERLGFRAVERNLFPAKIWSDCRLCPKNACCDEVALLTTSED
ncbi:MAG: GNAT family N-acetyltransferase [Victivallaceae bacterium]|nr:GNAT family N-acetyltransferase [Victivallaceae bacterium]